MKSQKDKIIDLLLDRFPRYATNFELNKICFRYGGRICDLRKEGWAVENIQNKDDRQEWRAWLASPIKGDEPYAPVDRVQKQGNLI